MEHDHKFMIEHNTNWPSFPFLPVKRDGELGVIFANASNTVRLANLFSLPSTEEEFCQLPCYEYASTDELLLAGWIVD